LVLTPLTPLEKSTVDKVGRVMKRAMPEEESTLAGSGTNLQITSMIQTLINNRNQGTLTLFDARNYPFARFFIKDNALTHVKYSHLINEEALFKMLTSGNDEETYQFTFTPDFEPEWARFSPVARGTTGLLMDAYSRLETCQQILADFGNP